MPYFLMKEDADEFWCYANDVDEAQDNAAMFNAVVLRQATQKEQTFLTEEES